MYNRYMYFEPNSLRNSLVFALGLLFSLLPLFASAQGNPPPPSESSSCFDYYKFQSITIDLHAEKQVYKAGEGARLIGSLTNKNTYPVVGGSLILRISKFDPR